MPISITKEVANGSVQFTFKGKNDAVFSDTGFSIQQRPKASDWECHMTPGLHGLVLRPTEGNVPNAFHRFMQRVCLGFRWVKKGAS